MAVVRSPIGAVTGAWLRATQGCAGAELTRRAVGVFCVLNGSAVLVVPHHFNSPAYQSIKSEPTWWGVLFMLAGGALLLSGSSAPRWAILVAHGLAGAVLFSLAAAFAAIAGWTDVVAFGSLGIVTAAAPFLARSAPQAPARCWLMALALGAASAGNGLLMLLVPNQFRTVLSWLSADGLRLTGAVLLGVGVVLVAVQFRPVPDLVRLGAHVLAAAASVLFVLLGSSPTGTWTGIAYYGGFGLLIGVLPWLGSRMDRADPASLQSRLVLALSAAAAVPLLVATVLGLSEGERLSLAQDLESYQRLAIALGEEVADDVAFHRAAVVTLAAEPGLASLPPDDRRSVLRRFGAAFPGVALFAILDPTGRPLARSDGRALDPLPGPLVSALAANPNGTTSLISTMGDQSETELWLVAPIAGSAGGAGWAAEAWPTARLGDHLSRAIGGAVEGSSLRAYLVDADGHAIVAPMATPAGALLGLADRPPVARFRASSAAAEEVRYTSDDGEWLAGLARVPGLGWGVVVEGTVAASLAPTRRARDLAFGVLIVFGVGAVAAGALGARAIAAPLGRLGDAIDDVARGDLNSPVPRSGFTEVARLASAFEDMQHKLATRTAERELARAEAERAHGRVARLNAHLEERVARRTAELEAAVKELEAFSYSVSHDLRAPLRAIVGFSRMLLDEHAAELAPDARRYLATVSASATRMGQLIDDLLALSRVSRQELTAGVVDPADVAKRVLEDLAAEYPGREVEVTIASMPPCHADPVLLGRVYANLLGNALKFTKHTPAPRIEVGWEDVDGRPAYFVRDNGAGFDMRYADRLFGVFQRLHRATDYEGTGVGLAIVQRIVHRHGGSVWADGAVGRGATFYFTLGTA